MFIGHDFITYVRVQDSELNIRWFVIGESELSWKRFTMHKIKGITYALDSELYLHAVSPFPFISLQMCLYTESKLRKTIT